jgi:hypothetical protein
MRPPFVFVRVEFAHQRQEGLEGGAALESGEGGA